MEMLLEQIDFTQKYDYTLVLTKKNKSLICILAEAYARTLNVKMDDINSLTFTIPYYIEDEITHQQIKNPNYDYVIEENMVLLKAGDASNPYFEAYFIIKGIEEETDKLSKSVRCSSREVMLNKDNITIDGSELQLKKDDVNIANGVFDVLESETTWSAGYIDPSAKVEPPSIGNVNRYRWFDALSKPWLQFLREDIQSAFNCVLFYDTKNKLINVYNRDSYGSHTGIILTEENYIKNLKKKTNSENIVTKLYVSGRDETTFESINPLGTDYVLNYDYFKANGQMSTELVSALDRYDILINEKNTEFQNLLSQINDLNSQLTVKQTEMSTLNEELKALKILQSQYMADGDNVNLPTATTNVNNKVAEIGQKQNEINTINTQIDTLNTQKNAISSAIDKNNATDGQGKIFNNDLLDELSDFTYAESWSNNYYDSTQLKQLYNAGIEKIKDWSVPPIEFEVDSVDLFGAMETQHWWDKIKLGDLVRFYSERLNLNTDVRIVEYTYNIDSNDLKFTFSNKDKKLDDTRSIANTTRKANDSSKILNVKKLEWNDIKNTKNAVDTFLNNALNTSRQTIISQVGRNKISIDENGIFVYDADNINHALAILSGLIAFTQDGWASCSTALDNSGLYAKYLVGQIILGKQLFIQDTTGQLSIVGNLLTIKDDQNRTRIRLGKYDTSAWGLQILSKNNGQVVLDENGLLQSYSFSIADNVDSTHTLKVKFYIPNNVLSVRSINLAFSLEKFRAYEKSIIGGSSSKSTSDGGGTHRHRMFAFSNVPPTNTPTEQYFICSSQDASLSEVYTAIATDSLYDLHTYDASSQHSHGMQHTHSNSLEYGIFESTYPSNIKIIIDGTLRDGSNYNSDQQNIELSQWINSSGWHTIELQSDAIGRINASLFVSCFVSS